MKAKKTVTLHALTTHVNALLSSDYTTVEGRNALSGMLESILAESNSYCGFNYLGWITGGYQRWKADGEPADYGAYIGDTSRKQYYTSHNPQLLRAYSVE